MPAARMTSATPKVTLTFDNGPTPGVTEEVLDMLAGRGLRATFFVVGTRLRHTGRPGAGEASGRIGGHWVGHHTTTHTVLLGGAGDAAGCGAGGDRRSRPRDGGIRPAPPSCSVPTPTGGVLDRRVFSEAAVRYLQEHGYTCVLWNSVPHDWDDPGGWVDRALADVFGQPWTVRGSSRHSLGRYGAACPDFLDELAIRGAAVVQDFPESCLPIVAGEVKQPLSQLIMEATT